MHSIQAQSDYYTQYISSNADYEPVGIFSDEGISGTGTLRREAFRQLLECCRAGLVDMVITKSVSRFGRNTVDTLKAIRELKALGVDVYFEKESVHTKNSEGEILLTLMSAVAQNESLAQSDNVKWGLRRKYETGSAKSVPCGKLLGYDKIDGELVINEPEAEIVRRIYREFLDGYSISRIARGLTADGIPSEQGNAVWDISSIGQILRNEKFKGDTLFQKTYNTDHLTKKRAKNDGKLPKYYLENSHPAIIDKETWECVRLELERQKRYCKEHLIRILQNSSSSKTLSSKLICGTCGRTMMQLVSKRVGDEGYRYWRCTSFNGKHGTQVEGRTFTPRPMAQWSKYPDSNEAKYRANHRKLPEERQMLCTDVEVDAGVPEKAFIDAWNKLVNDGFTLSIAPTDDALTRYRKGELMRLIVELGRIDTMPFELMLQTLDCICVKPEGGFEVAFLAGVRVTGAE